MKDPALLASLGICFVGLSLPNAFKLDGTATKGQSASVPALSAHATINFLTSPVGNQPCCSQVPALYQ